MKSGWLGMAREDFSAAPLHRRHLPHHVAIPRRVHEAFVRAWHVAAQDKKRFPAQLSCWLTELGQLRAHIHCFVEEQPINDDNDALAQHHQRLIHSAH
jgi:hypothetical protein